MTLYLWCMFFGKNCGKYQVLNYVYLCFAEKTLISPVTYHISVTLMQEQQTSYPRNYIYLPKRMNIFL